MICIFLAIAPYHILTLRRVIKWLKFAFATQNQPFTVIVAKIEKHVVDYRKPQRKHMNKINKELCDCDCCTNLLNLGNTGKIEIWYGTGSNGKTTLLRALIQKLGTENCLTISTQNDTNQWISMHLKAPLQISRIKDTTKLICIREVSVDDNGKFARLVAGSLNPNVRYVMTTNFIYPWMLQSRICHITRFSHTFPESA
jgi:hypothetical protein